MARRQFTDSARSTLTMLPGLLVAVLIAVLGRLNADDSVEPHEPVILAFLIGWLVYALLYLWWTHWSLTRRDSDELTAYAQAADAFSRHGLWRWLDHGGAISWTMSSAMLAVFTTIGISQLPTQQTDWLIIILGLLAVACAWAMMVYSFAEQYLRLALLERYRPHLQLQVEEEPLFEDYLTFAVLVSTMAATSSAKVRTRKAWTTVRANVLLAFVFNTVIVAMVVSLLFGGMVD